MGSCGTVKRNTLRQGPELKRARSNPQMPGPDRNGLLPSKTRLESNAGTGRLALNLGWSSREEDMLPEGKGVLPSSVRSVSLHTSVDAHYISALAAG